MTRRVVGWIIGGALLAVLGAWLKGTASGVAAIVALAAILLAWAPFLTRSDLERRDRDTDSTGSG